MSHREEQHRKKLGSSSSWEPGTDGRTDSVNRHAALIAQEENELHNMYFHQKNSSGFYSGSYTCSLLFNPLIHSFKKTQISSGSIASNQKPDTIQISNLGFNKNMSICVNLHNTKLGTISALKSNIHYIIQNNTLHTSLKTQCLNDKEQSNNAVHENTRLL